MIQPNNLNVNQSEDENHSLTCPTLLQEQLVHASNQVGFYNPDAESHSRSVNMTLRV